MAWVSKEIINSKKEVIKALNKEYGVKASLSGTNTHSMKLKVSSGSIDFVQNYADTIRKLNAFNPLDTEQSIARVIKTNHVGVNHYHMHKYFDGVALEYMRKALSIMQEGNHDNSDTMTDYFDVGWYIDIDVGSWDKPYQLIK